MKPLIMLDGRPAQGRPRGMGVYTQRLAEALSALPDPPRLVAALDETAGPDPWQDLNGLERAWGKGGNPILWEQRALPKLAVRLRADLIHSPANTSPWHGGIPQVVTVHDTIFLRKLSHISGRIYARQAAAHFYYRFGVAPGAHRSRMVLTDSEYSRAQLQQRLNLPAERVRVIHLAEPYDIYPLNQEELQQELQALDLPRPYLLSLGAIDQRKNTANLVRGFARLPRSLAPLLVLAGFEMPDRSPIPGLVRELDLTQRVRFLGYLPVRQLTAVFQGATVFVYPTREEGFGLPLLQAFNLGIPVITSRRGAIPEVAGDAACYVDPDDPRDISRGIVKLLADPDEAERLAFAGYEQSKLFSWQATAQKTLEVYLQALQMKT